MHCIVEYLTDGLFVLQDVAVSHLPVWGLTAEVVQLWAPKALPQPR